jgi:hypothetical protein
MDPCGLSAIVFPSLYAAKNDLEAIPCNEDPSCIGYLIVVSIGIIYLVYRIFTRGMSRQGRREALWNFLFRKPKNKN